MRIAFYAPLKPPDHDVPSGDRRIARLFLEALRVAGHQPFVASRLRSFDAAGVASRQTRMAACGRRIAERLIDRWTRKPETAAETAAQSPPGLWFTYHLYYKAPDWIGPAVARALGIPYVVAEASFAAKRAEGPWALGHRAVADAVRRADRVIGINAADRDGVLPLLGHPTRWVQLAPFLDARAYAAPARAPTSPLRLITVAMMRPGDKLASYRVLGDALSRLLDLPWSLEVIGDGPARDRVAAALSPLGDRVRYAGILNEAAIAARLADADLFVWAAINEAFGMALVEAQASGLAVVAGASGGVAATVAEGMTGILTPPGDAAAFAAAVRSLIADPARCAAMGAAARRKIERQHDLPIAADRLAETIAALQSARAA